jgi:hypothetical protein
LPANPAEPGRNPGEIQLGHGRERLYRWVMAESMRRNPLLHITERILWETAKRSGSYAISTRGISLEQQGFIHSRRNRADDPA